MLANTARKIEAADEVIQDIGRVARVEPQGVVVECARGTFHARRATSCLVEPEVDDEVLFAGKSSGALYVIAILERREASAITLSTRGDLRVTTTDGRIALAAAKGIDLVSSRDISLTSDEVQLRASRGMLFLRTLQYVGERVIGDVGLVKTTATKLERIAESIVERVKRSYRYVEDADHVRAGNIDYVSEDTMRLKGRNAMMHADLLVKLDGDQIHLG